ncbi:RICIN domain-containing protein [Streptomyces sp. ISL-11]|uniref:RICIN domain-containing protein n=1 Tax=Streptomyces sp. ISL-11 TaxID=2819174 RepID=UPI001BE786F6|nr:RICIN domain-containing protein [Streptomyces sp. ISL-11]MBT2383512.1 RICIN domain-containing protein [Streptomyces sp. ISL-11]
MQNTQKTRKARMGLGIAAGLGAVAFTLGAAAGAQAQGPLTGPAAGKRVVDIRSADQLPGVGSSAKPAADVVYRTPAFTNHLGNQCLDGDRNTIPNNGAVVQLWGCNNWDNQSWYWTPAPGQPTGNYTIQNGYRSQCLDGDTNTIPNNGAKVQLWACNGWTNQIWSWNGTNLQNRLGSQCLDGDTNTIPNNGAKVQLWGCNGWTNQKWTFNR